MHILLTGGGTGGHITPLVAIIRELKVLIEKEQILDLEIFYLGPNDKLTKRFLKEEQIEIFPVASGKLRNYFSLQNGLDFIKIPLGILQALWHMLFIMPDVIFSKGGYGAIPAVIAGIIYRIPILIHDSDAIPGKVSRFSARFARRIGISFVGAADFFPKEKTAMVGVPIRKRLLGGNTKEAKDSFEAFTRLPVVGIIGASQGSSKINEAVLGVIQELADEFEIIHQTGEENFEAVSGEGSITLQRNHDHYHAFGFFDEGQLRDFYAACDLIVSRASGTVIYEIASWGRPSILIPLKIAAQDHQRANAYEYAGTGAALVIEESNLTPHILLAEIRKLVSNPDKLKKMGEAAQRFARVDSAEVVAREILKLGIH